MSLLQNEDFVVWQLRTAYLSRIKDGVGERLINVNNSVVNQPAFRAAGWPSAAPGADIKRTYSPPIPTAGIASDYFQAPTTRGGLRGASGEGGLGRDAMGLGLSSFGGDEGVDEDYGGMVTGGAGSSDTVGPGPSSKRRRRAKEQQEQEEDDSSSLSDESDDEENQRAAQQIKFTKMPLRTRAGSSPLQNTSGLHLQADGRHGPELMITSPSRPPDTEHRLRSGSLGAVTMGGADTPSKERVRRDTVTSSDMSSENELDPSIFKRKQIPHAHRSRRGHLLSQRIQEADEREAETGEMAAEEAETEDTEEAHGEVAPRRRRRARIADPAIGAERLHQVDEEGAETDTSLDSESFTGSPDSGSSLNEDGLASSLAADLPTVPSALGVARDSPRRAAKQVAPGSPGAPSIALEALPPARPISIVHPPVSELTKLLRAKDKPPENPLLRFAPLSGKDDRAALYIKIYCPFSKSSRPLELLLRRTTHEKKPVTVADAIGYALLRYNEEELKPPVDAEKQNVNRWILRMVEDDEVDFDFPPLQRMKPIVDFTSNNNRGVRGRSREKPWDEFGLVEASETEYQDNEKVTPDCSSTDTTNVPTNTSTLALAPSTTPSTIRLADTTDNQQPSSGPSKPAPQPIQPSATTSNPAGAQFRNPITFPPRKDSAYPHAQLADQPTGPVSHATPRMGAPAQVTVRFTDPDAADFPATTRTTTINATTDTYIAEVHEAACAALGVRDPAAHVLRVRGTATVAPADRTVEALGARRELDLGRRRFVSDASAFGFTGAGSPATAAGSSPNAPLLISTGAGAAHAHKKGKRGGAATPRPVEVLMSANSGALAAEKRYVVTRKQPMSFASSSTRILALDGEYMHIMPAGEGGGAGGAGGGPAGGTRAALFADAPARTTTVHFSSVVHSKVNKRHPRSFRVVVYRERETKRYDFEAHTAAEAQEIVAEIKSGVERFGVEKWGDRVA